MLFWQPNEHKRRSFWSKLFFVSASVHCVVLFVVFFIYHGCGEYHIDIIKGFIASDAKVVLMPLHKVVPKTAKKTGAKTAQAVLPKKEVVSKQEKAKTAMAVDKPKEKVAQVKKSEAIKLAKLEKQKKEASLKASAFAQAMQDKLAERKEEKILRERKEKVSEKKPLDTNFPTENSLGASGAGGNAKKIQELAKNDQTKPAHGAVPAEALREGRELVEPQPSAADTDDTIYVGRAELEAMQVQTEIQQEIERLWTPPVGLSKNLVCQIRLVVDWQGAVCNAAIDKGSGVLVYDVHARNAARNIKIPKAVWGKELVLHFKQG